ncbi:MAG: hypothetical protein ACLP22_22845 [Solirubrobacteraceae bacterium]
MLDRAPSSVAADLDSGDLLPRFARTVYGVVAEEHEQHDGVRRWKVDREATATLRAEMRRERLRNAVPATEFLRRERERILDRDLIEPVTDMYRSSMELSPAWASKFRSFWELPEDLAF